MNEVGFKNICVLKIDQIFTFKCQDEFLLYVTFLKLCNVRNQYASYHIFHLFVKIARVRDFFINLENENSKLSGTITGKNFASREEN